MIASFKLGKDGFVVRLASGSEVIEDSGQFVSGVLDGLGCTMPSALGPGVAAKIGLVVVKGLGGHAEGLGDAIFGLDLGATDTSAGTEAVFWTDVHPRRETVVGWKFGKIGAEFTEDRLNAKDIEAWDESQIDTKDALQMASKIKVGRGCGRGGRVRSSGRAIVFALERLDALLNFAVAVGNEVLIVPVSR